MALGVVLGTIHLAWALLVALGLAQSVVDFFFRFHFIKPALVIVPFDFAAAALLVALTAVCGSVVGFLFAKLWNFLQGRGS